MKEKTVSIDASIIVSASEMTFQPVTIRAENGKVVLEMPPDCGIKHVNIELDPDQGYKMIEVIHQARRQQNHVITVGRLDASQFTATKTKWPSTSGGSYDPDI